MEQLTLEQFLAKFDKNTTRKFWDQLKVHYPTAVALVMFENLQLDSSALGSRTACAVGPDNTFKSVEDCDGKWLNDLPSQRQYPVAWIPADVIRDAPKPALVWYIQITTEVPAGKKQRTKVYYSTSNGWQAFSTATEFTERAHAERLALSLRQQQPKETIEVVN